MEPRPYLRFEWRIPKGVRVVPNYGVPALAHAEGPGDPFPDLGKGKPTEAEQLDAAHQALRPSRLDPSDGGLVAYGARFGLFGLPAFGAAAGLGELEAKAEAVWPIVEPLHFIRLAVAEYHLALALGAALARPRFDERPFLAPERGSWRLRWRIPAGFALPEWLAMKHSWADDGEELLREPPVHGIRLDVREGYLDSWTATTSPVRAATPREAAREWLGLLVAARAGAWAPWGHEWTDEGLRLFVRVTSPLGLAWHRLGGGPDPMRCQWKRCGQPFQPSPELRKMHAAFCSKRCAKAAERAHVRAKAPTRRGRKA